MKKNKVLKALALSLAFTMSVAITGCEKGAASIEVAENVQGMDEIQIGTWWVQYYDSNDESIADSPDYTSNQPLDADTDEIAREKELGLTICQLKWDNKDEIEERYGITFEWVNLTYDGVKESINTSIPAGNPDCDVYLVDTNMGVPAQIHGLAVDLRTVLPEDADIFNDQQVVSYLDLCDGRVCIIKRVEAQATVEGTYPLGFNVQLLESYGLEDPRDLYARGEWTWEKFIEYCEILTDDTDDDGVDDQFGYSGYAIETFEQLMLSNGASVASGQNETLSSAATGEALTMMYNMYNEYQVCAEYGDNYIVNRNMYRNGNVGFFPIAAWLTSDNHDYNYDGLGEESLPFDIAYVQWPVGPSGSQQTNAGKNATSGEYYIIPVGVEDPELVYNFLYDYWNWFDGDISIRDDKGALNWWYRVTSDDPVLQEANFEVMNDIGSRTTFDLWDSMNINYDWDNFIAGNISPEEFQNNYKSQVQAGLDQYFSN